MVIILPVTVLTAAIGYDDAVSSVNALHGLQIRYRENYQADKIALIHPVNASLKPEVRFTPLARLKSIHSVFARTHHYSDFNQSQQIESGTACMVSSPWPLDGTSYRSHSIIYYLRVPQEAFSFWLIYVLRKWTAALIQFVFLQVWFHFDWHDLPDYKINSGSFKWITLLCSKISSAQ